MNRSYLQGTSWHYEQMKKNCKDGSKYCRHNKNICTCTYSINYHKKCIGKGDCEDFESKGTEARGSSPVKLLSFNEVNVNIPKQKKIEGEIHMQNEEMVDDYDEDLSTNVLNENLENINETREEKFKRLSKQRLSAVVDDLRKIANLSNTAQYTYTEDDLVKMFEYLDKALAKTKKSFQKEEFMEEFKW